ncbi:EGF-like repeat and discoidin I-like domain-containing protein 3 [Acropora muricata]|uniref:EGF-like repeat and discoidin I-like domain-containing protein 3 n=1 Tax=Acropora muricata TaxID=159855 RepID=UPI0034E4998B
MECVFECLRNNECFSFNFAIFQDVFSKQRVCHLLSEDKYKSPHRFVLSNQFHHYSISSSCESSPCNSGEACLPLYNENDYECDCPTGSSEKPCDKPVTCESIGVADKNFVPDSRMTASSIYSSNWRPYYGRFDETRGVGRWCPQTKTNRNDYLQVDMESVRFVCSVATQGTNSPYYSTSYKLRFSIDGVNWKIYKTDNKAKVFPANTGTRGIVKHSLLSVITARYLRFYPVTFRNWPCLRVEIFAQK